jgi:hypothetical protein
MLLFPPDPPEPPPPLHAAPPPKKTAPKITSADTRVNDDVRRSWTINASIVDVYHIEGEVVRIAAHQACGELQDLRGGTNTPERRLLESRADLSELATRD